MKMMRYFFPFFFEGKSHLLAYTLVDGSLGMYDENVRLWRVKVFEVKLACK